MKNYQIISALTLLLILSSCNSDKDFSFEEPYKNHYTFLGLTKDVKSVSYEKQIFEITDGGYFPNDKGNNDIVALMNYPYQSNELKYMANINSSSIFNYPITANQYLFNRLQINEGITHKNVNIKLQNGKIKSYSNQDEINRDYKLTCEYDDNGKLILLKEDSRYPMTVHFKFKGNFLKQIIEEKKEKTDTINFVFERVSDNEIKIKRNDKNITVYLNRTPNKTTLEKIIYNDDNQTFEFEDSKLVLNSKVKKDGSYDTYYKLEYKNNQLIKILNSTSYSKNTVVYKLNDKNLISSINVETDKKRMRNLGLTFDYKENDRFDWTEMSYFVNRKYYDEAKRNIEKIKEQLKYAGYSDYQIIFHYDVTKAMRNAELARAYCSKTTIKRKLKYN